MKGHAHRALAAIGVLGFAGVFALTLKALAASQPRGLTEPVLGSLARTGVTNPVTAVILNYRGYDTLIEIAVITVAGLSVVALLGPLGGRWSTSPGERLVIAALLRGVAPMTVLFGAYLLWKGAKQPGGAFQGAAVVTGALALGFLAGVTSLRDDAVGRLLAVVGLAVFVAAAVVLGAGEAAVLTYPSWAAGWIILGIESACFVSLSLVLAWMLAAFGAEARRGSEDEK